MLYFTASHFAAGLCSGLLSAVLLQPADLLKTRIQQSPRTSRSASIPLVGTATSLPSSPSPTGIKRNLPSFSTNKVLQSTPSSSSSSSSLSSSRTIRTCLAEILAQPEPIRELWRGTVASALRTGFGSALYFTTLNAMRREVARLPALGDGMVGTGRPGGDGRKDSETPTLTSTSRLSLSSASALPRLSNTANLATGAAARALAGLILMPVTVLKVRMESNLYDGHDNQGKKAVAGTAAAASSSSSSSQTKKTRSTMRAATRAIAQTDGLRGFFAGTGATAVRDAPYAGLYVLFYERSKDILGRARAVTPLSSSSSSSSSSQSAISTNLISASLAAGLATAVTNPFDAIKTRLQLQPRRYGNMLRAARIMITQEGGVRTLFDGLALRMGRKALSSAIAWTVYEEIIRRVEM